jgi:hypothetical protein
MWRMTKLRRATHDRHGAGGSVMCRFAVIFLDLPDAVPGFRINSPFATNVRQSSVHRQNAEIRSSVRLDFVELIVRAIRPILETMAEKALGLRCGG